MKKRLTRTHENKLIAGVCRGLAEYFDVDVVIIRAAFLIAFFGYGTGLLAYIVLWFLMPKSYKPIINREVSYE